VVTVSVGIAGFPQHGRSAGEVLRAADAALYLAKRAGRDGWAMPGRSAAAPSVPQAG
jgi:diguanylate cyclase (GGDEF)-like protein